MFRSNGQGLASRGGNHRAFTSPSLAFATVAFAQTTIAPRDEPAKTLPVLDTVSPELQAVIAQPLRAGWNKPPTTPDGWHQLVSSLEASLGPQVAPMSVEGGSALAVTQGFNPLAGVVGRRRFSRNTQVWNRHT